MTQRIELTGKKFGAWQVVELAPQVPYRQAAWICVCDCGVIKTVRSSDLRSGVSRGCRSCVAEMRKQAKVR